MGSVKRCYVGAARLLPLTYDIIYFVQGLGVGLGWDVAVLGTMMVWVVAFDFEGGWVSQGTWERGGGESEPRVRIQEQIS